MHDEVSLRRGSRGRRVQPKGGGMTISACGDGSKEARLLERRMRWVCWVPMLGMLGMLPVLVDGPVCAMHVSQLDPAAAGDCRPYRTFSSSASNCPCRGAWWCGLRIQITNELLEICWQLETASGAVPPSLHRITWAIGYSTSVLRTSSLSRHVWGSVFG
jgi:hypothetical protein